MTDRERLAQKCGDMLGAYDEMAKDLTMIMRSAGIPEEKIYATIKTGLMPTADNNCSPVDVAEWKSAVLEYRALSPEAQQNWLATLLGMVSRAVLRAEAPMARIDDVRELAVKVMGWEVRDHFNGIRLDRPGRVSWYPNDFGGGVWDPYTDVNAALEVVEAMTGRGYWLRAEYANDAWYVIVHPETYNRASISGNSVCEAICAAALAAIREGK